MKGDYTAFPSIENLVVQMVEKQTAMDYFTILSLVLNDRTMTKRKNSLKEVETLRRLKQLGIAQGVTFDSQKISTKLKTALERGFAAGKKKNQLIRIN